MAVDVPMMQQPPLLEVVHDLRVGVLHELAREGIIAGHNALQVHWLHEVQPLLPPQAKVLVTKRWRNVDYAGAVLHGNEVGGHHLGRKVAGPISSRQNA